MPVGALWRRGHKPVEPMGYAYIHVLGDWINAHGATILTETRAKHLLMKDNKVVGIEAEKNDGSKVIVHAKAVVLASGGFGANMKWCKNTMHIGSILTTICRQLIHQRLQVMELV